MNDISTEPVLGPGTVKIAGELERAGVPRRAKRVRADMSAGLRLRGARVASIDIIDISTDGFRGMTHLDLVAGDQVWLRLPGIESWQAEVMWKDRYTVGFRFERPLYPAVLEQVLRSAR